MRKTLLLLIAVTVSYSAWAQGGPPGAIVNALITDPNSSATVYAATSGGGIFKSVDSGGAWTAINSGLTNEYVLALTIDPANAAILYAGTSGGGLFKSLNE